MKRRTDKMIWLVLVVILAGAAPVDGQDSADGKPYVIAHRYTLPSEILGEDRPIAVALPPGYDSMAYYPVIYVMDGFAHLTHTVGSVRILASNRRMPHSIVVAIGNTPGNRDRDMTPPSTDAEASPSGGGAADFQAFLRDELKPWINARYPTRAYDVLIGHSRGGLFISHLLNSAPDLFDAYISISPALWWDDERYVASMDDVFDRFPDAKGALYMTMGNEGGQMLAGAWRLAGTLEKHAPEGFRWKWVHLPTETHGTVPARSTYDGLTWIFSGFYPVPLLAELSEGGAEVVSRVDAHYSELSSKLGWEVTPPFDGIVHATMQAGQAGRFDDAIAIADAAVAWHPESASARHLLGYSYMSACRLGEAEEHITRALRMAEENEEADELQFVRSSLDQLHTKMEDPGSCTEAW